MITSRGGLIHKYRSMSWHDLACAVLSASAARCLATTHNKRHVS